MKDFFISYNHADQQWAEWIAWELEAAGYTTVVQSWDFRPGSNFTLEMHSASQAAERTIAVLSPDYLEAPYTLAEWAAAFAEDPTAKQGKLLPIRVRECDPGWSSETDCLHRLGRPTSGGCKENTPRRSRTRTDQAVLGSVIPKLRCPCAQTHASS